uniref:Carbohydrate sulfotransferase n=1 Tax=Branchiostoma floridae TaxID=7739 RepID=C3Z2J3_BRAFL|eukprot:XP_002597232.1 hypothetical protein BRAFLDRAFT_66357 [Branchiostoma floridae]
MTHVYQFIGHWGRSNMAPPQPRPVKLGGKQNGKMEEDREQTRRKEMVEEYCKNKSSSNKLSRRRPMDNFFVSDKYKVLYCKIGKTGSTTTSALLYNLEYGTNYSQQEYWKHTATVPMKRLTSYTKDEQMLRLNTYKKLVVSRNPLESLCRSCLNVLLCGPFCFRKNCASATLSWFSASTLRAPSSLLTVLVKYLE